MRNLRTGYANPNRGFFQIQLRRNSPCPHPSKLISSLAPSSGGYWTASAVRITRVLSGLYEQMRADSEEIPDGLLTLEVVIDENPHFTVSARRITYLTHR